MTDKRPLDDFELDGLFAAARDTAPVPTGDLMARVMADAEAQVAAQATPAPVARPGLWAGLLAAIGGWPAAAGLATAAVTGVMVGFYTPDTLDDLTGGYIGAALGYGVEDFMPSYDGLLEEG